MSTYPQRGKSRKVKTTNTHFAFPSTPGGAIAICWHKTLGENRRERRQLWKCRSVSEVKNLRNLTDYDGIDFCVYLNKIHSPWRRTQRIPPKHRYRVPIFNGVKNQKTVMWTSAWKSEKRENGFCWLRDRAQWSVLVNTGMGPYKRREIQWLDGQLSVYQEKLYFAMLVS